MLRLPTFELQVPRTLDEATRILAVDPKGTRVVAGGTDLWPNMKRRHQSAKTVVSLRRVPGLRGICENGKGLVIGAMTTLTEIAEHPAIRKGWPGFARAVLSISAPVLRNMGTIGGNLCLDTRCTYYNQNEEWRRSIGYCMKEVGETCWVAPGSPRCWAIAASDAAPLLCAIGAMVRLVSRDGERVLPLADLYRDDGIHYLAKNPDEILTEVMLPPADASTSTYWKLRRRGSIDFPVLGVGAAVTRDSGGIVKAAAIFLGAVASFPVPARDAAAALVGKPLGEQSIAEAALLAQKISTPMDNTDFVVNWRKTMVNRYVDGALREIGGLAPKVGTPRHGLFVA